MKFKDFANQLYSLIYVKICDLIYGLTKKGYDYVDETPFYNFDFMRATNPYSKDKFHIAIPYIQETGKEYFVVCDHWSRHKSTKCAKISFHSPEYVRDWQFLGKKKWILTREEKENLIAFLNQSIPDYISRWKDIICTYNNNQQYVDEVQDIPEDLPMPDYMQLPEK